MVTPAQKSTTVACTCGANRQEFELADKTVAEARQQLREVLNIPKNAEARVGGSKVKDTHVLSAGEQLEFVKPASDKG